MCHDLDPCLGPWEHQHFIIIIHTETPESGAGVPILVPSQKGIPPAAEAEARPPWMVFSSGLRSETCWCSDLTSPGDLIYLSGSTAILTVASPAQCYSFTTQRVQTPGWPESPGFEEPQGAADTGIPRGCPGHWEAAGQGRARMSSQAQRPWVGTATLLATAHHAPLLQRFQFVQVPGNHYIHMNAPHHVASVISSFLQSRRRIPAQL